jgi:hypothetical protein
MKRVFEMPVQACAVAFALFPVLAHAGIVVNDRFGDGNRNDPASPVYSEAGVDGDLDGDIESSWYGSSGTLSSSAGHLTMTNGTGSTSFTTYFASEAAPITLGTAGDTMTATWVFTPTNVNATNTNQNFRVALVNSPAANRLTADGNPGTVSGGNYDGYAMFMNMGQTLGRSTPFNLLERNPAGTAFLSASGDWQNFSPAVDDGNTNDPGYVSGTQYTFTMTLTRNASNGLDILARMAGTGLGPNGQGFLQVTTTDATPSSFTYDMFGIRPSTAATTADSFDTTLFRVDATIAPVPEPTSLAAVALGLSLLRRRR